MNMTGSSSRIAEVSRPFASAGVDGMTTLSPATCVNQASSDFECCAALPRPEPPCVRTTSGTRACPPNMKRFCAAWFTSWSIARPEKSMYMSSTTGRRPVSAAPTPASRRCRSR